MKKIFFTLMMVMFLGIIQSYALPIIIFGTRSHPCGGNGCYCEGDKGICLIVKPTILDLKSSQIKSYPLSSEQGIAEIDMIGTDKLKINMLRDEAASNERYFYVFEDVYIPNAFGTGITISKGKYEISYDTNSIGTIIVNIK